MTVTCERRTPRHSEKCKFLGFVRVEPITRSSVHTVFLSHRANTKRNIVHDL